MLFFFLKEYISSPGTSIYVGLTCSVSLAWLKKSFFFYYLTFFSIIYGLYYTF